MDGESNEAEILNLSFFFFFSLTNGRKEKRGEERREEERRGEKSGSVQERRNGRTRSQIKKNSQRIQASWQQDVPPFHKRSS